MSESNLGRVQGGGFFGSTSTSATSIPKTTVQTNDVSPLVGDTIVNANGDLCKITAITSSAYSTTKYGSIKVEADFSDVKFATSDWERVMDVIMAGKAAEVFSITDTRDISVSGGQGAKLCILDLSGKHDIIADSSGDTMLGGFAPITLGVMTVIKPSDGTEYFPYDDSGSGGWEESTLRTKAMSDMLEGLPDEIKQYIVPVVKRTNVSSSSGDYPATIVKTEEKCFPLSLVEIMGNYISYACVGDDEGVVKDAIFDTDTGAAPYMLEGEQYDYFKAVQDGESPSGRRFFDSRESEASYWARTRSYLGEAVIIQADGVVRGCADDGEEEHPGVVFGFCVKRSQE